MSAGDEKTVGRDEKSWAVPDEELERTGLKDHASLSSKGRENTIISIRALTFSESISWGYCLKTGCPRLNSELEPHSR